MRVSFAALRAGATLATFGAVFGTLGLPSAADAQVKSFTTDHYVITFWAGTEGTARRVAEVAEEVFGPLAAAYDYYDVYAPIHIYVLDSTDFGNGAADEYGNSVIIWASNLDWEIRGEHPWIRNVLTHEISHVMTLKKAKKKWPFRFALFSVSRSNQNPDISFSLPLYYLSVPRWWSEGIAQLSSYQFGWDTWDSHRDMILRMAVLEDDLLSYEEMGTVSNHTGAYRGEQIYNQGYSLLIYLQSQYGREKVEALGDHAGTLNFDPAIRKVFGISAGQLFEDWQKFAEDNYRQQVAELRGTGGLFEGQALENLNGGVIDYHPVYSPDGKKLAYISSQDRAYRIPHLMIHDFDSGETKELDGTVDTRISWSPDGEEIVFLRANNSRNDLYIYDIAADKERRISAGLRARDPHFSPDGEHIAFVRNEDGNGNLGVIKPDGTGLDYLTNNNDGTQIYSPRWSPDGEWILFTIFRGEDRDIAMMRSDSPRRPRNYGIRDRSAADVPDSLQVFPDSLAIPAADTSGFTPLLATAADERDPFWLPDGSGFVFASDRSGIFNIYKYTMATGEVEQLTNVVGGAFTPSVSVDGRVAYASYHSNDYELFEFSLNAYRQKTDWGPSLGRNYDANFRGPKLSDEYRIGPYHGRRVVDIIPILEVGPTFVGNTFGLNQVSGGAQIEAGEWLGGDSFTAFGVVGKNFREPTDLNTDFGVFMEKRLLPAAAGNRTFNPSLTIGYRRREIDFVIASNQVTRDTIGAGTIYPVPADSVDLLIPNATQHRATHDIRKDLFKNVLALATVSVNLPLGQRHRLVAQYLHRNYDENWSLETLRQTTQFQVVQDSVDITQSIPANLTNQDTSFVNREEPISFYDGLEFFASNDITFAWQYRKVKPTEDVSINPTGRSVALIYRYMKSTIADSLAQRVDQAGLQIANSFEASQRRFTVNEYVGSYNEIVGLPFHNSVQFELLGAYRNIRLKRGAIADGGFFEGRYYWPLRYYLGGRNFLSGYPYFTRSGSKLAYGRLSYNFPVFRRISTSFLNFTFAKLYSELFAETGLVGNFDNFDADDFSTNHFISDVGAELKLQLFTNYRIPMTAFFQAAHPLNRNRERNWRRDDAARLLGLPEWDPVRVREERNLTPDADLPEDERIDRFRLYFGLGFATPAL